jgi:D-glycero-alpha-D-manno-heptose-7-phosphate kinase
MYDIALALGACGGMITRAGGGGFLLLYCREDDWDQLTLAMEELGLRRMNFRFDTRGAAITEVHSGVAGSWAS